MSGEALVFCMDQGRGDFGWFWHEADVLLYALGREVAEKKKTSAEAREIYEKYYGDDVDTYIMDPRDLEEEKTLILMSPIPKGKEPTPYARRGHLPNCTLRHD